MAIINLTDQEKLELSQILDDQKKPFENSLSRDLNALFAVIASDILATYSTFGSLPDIEKYRLELEAVLRKSYRRTGAFFSGVFQRTLKQVEPTSDENQQQIKQLQEDRNSVEAAILLLLLPFYQNQSRTQAGFILDTTKKIIRDVESQILIQQGLEGITKPRIETSKEIAQEVNKRNRIRSPNIGGDQVGDIAQKSQDVEAVETAKVAAIGGLAINPVKTWITTFINSRPAHVFAHGQKRSLGQLFTVGGEFLQYPKDASRGASPGNLINCACNSVVTM